MKSKGGGHFKVNIIKITTSFTSNKSFFIQVINSLPCNGKKVIVFCSL